MKPQKETTKEKIGEILNSVYSEVDSLYGVMEKITDDIVTLKDMRAYLQMNIADLESFTKKLDPIKQEVIFMTKVCDDLEEEKSELVAEIKDAEQDLAVLREDYSNEAGKAIEERERFLLETAVDRKFLTDERLRLEQEKKRLEKIDEELKIVENRFVKLFEGKGSSFKISK